MNSCTADGSAGWRKKFWPKIEKKTTYNLQKKKNGQPTRKKVAAADQIKPSKNNDLAGWQILPLFGGKGRHKKPSTTSKKKKQNTEKRVRG